MIMKRFWNKVEIKSEDECWPWKAGRANKLDTKDGNYGMFWNKNKSRMENAHRVAYRLTYGEFDENKLVCHRCDNPPCCNPKHLYLGDKGTNAADCVGLTGRQSRWHECDLILIRLMHLKGFTQRVIADLYKVNQSTISDILKDREYPSVETKRTIQLGY